MTQPEDTYLIVGKNEVLGERRFPADQKGRANVLYDGRRIRLERYKDRYFIVLGYLDRDRMDQVFARYAARPDRAA